MLIVHNISCEYPQPHQPTNLVLNQIEFSLQQGEIGCILGGSGSGKTTLLRSIAGLEAITTGQIDIDNKTVSSATKSVPIDERKIGLVFQDFALFPHLNVADNIAFGLHRLSNTDREQRTKQLLAMTSLEDFANRRPHELSGGQQQRVALARALAPKPKLLLMDEPFSNLDSGLRQQLAADVKALVQQENVTTLMVTHDQWEAFALADKIGVLQQGKLQQWDTPYQLYHEPNNRYVAGFIGDSAWLPALASQQGSLVTELGTFAMSNQPLKTITSQANGQVCHIAGTALEVMLRPDDLIHDDHAPMQLKVISKAFRGADFLYTLALPSGSHVLALVPSHHNHAVGEMIGIKVEAEHVIAFPTN